MALSPEDIQALAEAVAKWRMQEYIAIASYCLYVYYVLTTTDKEVSFIRPQKWSRGKALYMGIRYGTLVTIALGLVRYYRNYFLISLAGCKAIDVIHIALRNLMTITCDLSLGLCLGALLQVRRLYLFATLALSCGLPLVTGVISVISAVQYPAEAVSALDRELGYPCYVPSPAQWSEHTIATVGINVRAYLTLTATILLAALGIATVVVRYKGRAGRLMQVIRRDGGLYYLSLIAIRLCNAMIYTPGILSTTKLDSSPAFSVATSAGEIILPILAQRLLINMHKVDYMGSQPVASKLLFAPPPPGSEDDLEGSPDDF